MRRTVQIRLREHFERRDASPPAEARILAYVRDEKRSPTRGRVLPATAARVMAQHLVDCNVTLQELQSTVPAVTGARGGYGPRRVSRCRRLIAAELAGLGYSNSEIGRCLNVHHTSVFYMLHRHKLIDPPPPALTAGLPDLSGEWAI
jgi:hypothetical protein